MHVQFVTENYHTILLHLLFANAFVTRAARVAWTEDCKVPLPDFAILLVRNEGRLSLVLNMASSKKFNIIVKI